MMASDRNPDGIDSIRMSRHATMLAISPRCPEGLARKSNWCLNDFVLVKKLGMGGASAVYQGVLKSNGFSVALKTYFKAKMTPLNVHQVHREVKIHIKLNHPNIIDLWGAFEDEHHIILVVELAAEGDLFDMLRQTAGRMKESVVVSRILHPFMCGLSYLHSNNIIHRDIKLENTLFAADGTLKLADFGLSIDASHENPVTRLGTLDYMSPEVMLCPDKRTPSENKHNPRLKYNEKVDAWACGVLAYELLVGCPPFGMSTREASVKAIMFQQPKMPHWLPSGSVDFILWALTKQASARPSVSQLQQHSWIQQQRLATLAQQPRPLSTPRLKAQPFSAGAHLQKSSSQEVAPAARANHPSFPVGVLQVVEHDVSGCSMQSTGTELTGMLELSPRSQASLVPIVVSDAHASHHGPLRGPPGAANVLHPSMFSPSPCTSEGAMCRPASTTCTDGVANSTSGQPSVSQRLGMCDAGNGLPEGSLTAMAGVLGGGAAAAARLQQDSGAQCMQWPLDFDIALQNLVNPKADHAASTMRAMSSVHSHHLQPSTSTRQLGTHADAYVPHGTASHGGAFSRGSSSDHPPLPRSGPAAFPPTLPPDDSSSLDRLVALQRSRERLDPWAPPRQDEMCSAGDAAALAAEMTSRLRHSRVSARLKAGAALRTSKARAALCTSSYSSPRHQSLDSDTIIEERHRTYWEDRGGGFMPQGVRWEEDAQQPAPGSPAWINQALIQKLGSPSEQSPVPFKCAGSQPNLLSAVEGSQSLSASKAPMRRGNSGLVRRADRISDVLRANSARFATSSKHSKREAKRDGGGGNAPLYNSLQSCLDAADPASAPILSGIMNADVCLLDSLKSALSRHSHRWRGAHALTRPKSAMQVLKPLFPDSGTSSHVDGGEMDHDSTPQSVAQSQHDRPGVDDDCDMFLDPVITAAIHTPGQCVTATASTRAPAGGPAVLDSVFFPAMDPSHQLLFER